LRLNPALLKKSFALNHLRGARQFQGLLLLQSVDVIVETAFDRRLIDEVPVDLATGLQRLKRRAGETQRSCTGMIDFAA
jgi:hypothetical protein